ncbi:hypothetical protein KDA_72850 [Dictyobacter alpinus]|uniref:Uncharacterized protein n=1 Tax=Dictyobacter alpinus TaxID=2014873 RepID=A0A402BKD2_9CHLR|nr:hypothetical protein [Dictyobacter alpinus]GCE31801.1 hypothetical protein KDA_72850 [Dictyobacter alpinus]
MSQMQEPERQSYKEWSSESVGYGAYQGKEQAEWPQSQYDSQQKLRPDNDATLSTTNYVMAILSVVASSLIMALSIALVALTANVFGRTVGSGMTAGLPEGVFGLIIASFVVALVLLVFSIAGYVFSVVQISIIQKKLRKKN